MWKKKVAFSSSGVDTIIGTNCTLEGNLHGEGTIRIDGKVKGDVYVAGDIIVGSASVISGNIRAENIDLQGTVEGNVIAAGLIKMAVSARLYGDMQVKQMVVDEGAIFEGSCRMLSEVPPLTTAEKAEKSEKNTAPRKTTRDYKRSSIALSPDEKPAESEITG